MVRIRIKKNIAITNSKSEQCSLWREFSAIKLLRCQYLILKYGEEVVMSVLA